ncbi:MAG: hypothetical protein ACE5KM_10955 [Planctomycetaceae bacterium]
MKTFARFTFASLLAAGVAVVVTRLNAGVQTGQEPPAKSQTEKPAKPKSEAEQAKERQARRRATEAAQRALQQSADELARYQSYEADLKERVEIGGRIFNAKGKYTKGRGFRMKLKLAIEFGRKSKPAKAELLQVCDGQILMSLQTVNGKSRLTRRNVQQIQQAVANSTRVSPRRFQAALGLGGLPELLASLHRTMVFDNSQERTIDSERVTVFEGTWNAEYRATFLRQGGGTLPAHVPDRVRVFIDSRFLVRRIEYLKRSSGGSLRPMLTLGFTIRLNPRLDDKFFLLPKRTEYPNDVTNQYLQLIQPPQQAGGAKRP